MSTTVKTKISILQWTKMHWLLDFSRFGYRGWSVQSFQVSFAPTRSRADVARRAGERLRAGRVPARAVGREAPRRRRRLEQPPGRHRAAAHLVFRHFEWIERAAPTARSSGPLRSSPSTGEYRAVRPPALRSPKPAQTARRVGARAESCLELQREALTRARGQKVFEDKLSGARADRPGLSKILEMLRDRDTL